MDLQRINTIAVTVLLGLFVVFMLFLIAVINYSNKLAGHVDYHNSPYPYMVLAGAIIVLFLYWAVKTIRGDKTSVNPGFRGARLFYFFIHKDTPRKTGIKFIVVFSIAMIFGFVIVPWASLERTILSYFVFTVLLIFYILWAFKYDPPPLPEENQLKYFTQEELDDPMDRDIVLDVPVDVAFNSCLYTIRNIWGPLTIIDKNPEKGKIDFSYANSHLSFILTPAEGNITRVQFSIAPDLPQKRYPNKDRRQDIRYLNRIYAMLSGR